MNYKHCHIERHPLGTGYMVFNDTFPMIPPYFGTLKQCKKAAKFADMNAEELLKTGKL